MNKARLLVSAFLVAGFVTDAFGVTKKKFDFVVGVDGDFKAATAAAAAAKPTENNRFVIFFPDGEYDITKLTGDSHGRSTFSTSYVSLIGQTRDKTTISNTTDTEGISVTATLYFPNNNGMYMQDLTVRNKSSFASAEAARQVTIQQIGDKYIFKNVRLLSGQDTYYTNKGGRTYWEGGEIQGTVDFICGDGDVFFEGTNLVMTRNGGYITAAKTSTSWGYVFNNAKINVSNGSYNGTFYLGRSWGHAKTVFLNTTMYALPRAEGWGPDMNSGPDVFGEYNSKNGNGGAVDVSRRKTYFDGGKDASTAKSLKTVWNASDASKYTVANVLGGTDKWEPNKLTAQVAAPKILQEGAEITWADDENARTWAVFVNGKYKTNVITNSVSTEDIAVGSKVTVRAANSMGGLGASSNEITVLESNVTYYNVKVLEAVGGTIATSLSGSKVAEDKTVTFTAKPIDGWTFEGWIGASAAQLADGGVSETVTLQPLDADVEIGAVFTAKGVTTFQAESGVIENGINESTNVGFAGSGYVNFGAGNSYVKVPVYVDAPGIYTMNMQFANGSATDRDLEITAMGEPEILSFEKTSAWTTYITKETKVELPAGASFIRFAVVGNNDGPNLDQIELTPFDVKPVQNPEDSTTALAFEKHFENVGLATVRVYNLQGKLVHVAKTANTVMLEGVLPAGVYLMRVSAPGYNKQRMVQVK